MEFDEMVRVLTVLSGEQLLVVIFVVLDGYTETEVAAYFTEIFAPTHYSRERVHRIKRTALARMRRAVLADNLMTAA